MLIIGAFIFAALLIVAIYSYWNMQHTLGENRLARATDHITPYLVYENVLLEQALYSDQAITFDYTILGPTDLDEIRITERTWFRSEACANPDLQNLILQAGYVVVKNYYDTEQKLLMELRFGSNDCS